MFIDEGLSPLRSEPTSLPAQVMTNPTTDREQMVQSQLKARGISDLRVLNAMRRVPRHEFVLESHRSEAYEDRPLPIGDSQTISQPYVVALMLESLQIKTTDSVLEIGTGSGYATALLAELATRIFSMERHRDLADTARNTLTALGYSNVQVLTGDGTRGLPDEAPFDAILVSAAAPSIPSALLSQLREGGRMILPVGSPDAQQLQFIHKLNGQPIISFRESVRFVPLVSSVIKPE
jgi:protein-L-isoaspartate(D-aspartate) O-methyltransferase